MINEVVLVGRVGKDPDFKAFDSGSVAHFTLATTERGYKLPNGTDVPERTEWHNVTVRNRLAEIARDYLKKGMLIGLTGSIHYRQYERKDGSMATATEIQAAAMRMLSARQKEDNGDIPQPPKAAVSSAPTSVTEESAHAGNYVQDDFPF